MDEDYGQSAGEDPLLDDQADHDINSVAGVLKLYFRELENPIFPEERFIDLISSTSKSHPRKCLFFFFYIVIINPFFLFSRAWLGCWKSSSYTADNCDSSTACDRGHEIPVCFSKPVSLIRTTLRFVLLVLYLQQFICLEVSPSTVMRTWWTLTTLLSALAQLWCPYQTTRILWPVKRTLMRSLRQSSSITRPSSQPNENSKDLFMKNAWQGWRSTGRWTGAHNKKIPTSPTSASY